MTKAEIKAIETLRSTLTQKLTRILVDFQDYYLGSYVRWAIRDIETRLSHCKMKASEAVGTHKEGMFLAQANTLKKRLETKNMLTLQFINEAKTGYDHRFNKMIEKLVAYGFDTRWLKVQDIEMIGHDMSFLIVNNDVQCHARLIFVNGNIKAPHYRFITTLKKIK